MPTMTVENNNNGAMFWSMAYKVSDALMLLADEGALEQLISEPSTAAELARKLNWKEEPLNKVLNLLLHGGIIEKKGVNYHIPTSTSAVLPVIIMESQVRRWHASNQSLANMVQQGIAADPLGQIKEVNYLDNYQGAMASSSRALALHLFRHGGLPKSGRIMDIGGADGSVVEQLSMLMPDASFVVVDRPPVEPHFNKRIKAIDHPQRFHFVAEDVNNPNDLLTQAANADAVIISNLLHLLTITQIHTLLKALKGSLGPNCQLLVYDQFIDSDKFDAASLMVVDWVNLGSLFDMTESDMTALLETLNYTNITARRFPLIPGALVCSRTS
jgi:hypothetical protein